MKLSILLLSLVIALILWLVWRKYRVIIPEDQVGVISDRNRGGSTCFYPSGSYFLPPWNKKMLGLFSIVPKSASGQCSALTKEGNPITLNWILEYKLDPFSMDPVIQASMANILISTPIKMAENLTNQCLEVIVKQYTLDALLQDGFLQSLNVKSTRSTSVWLAAYGIVVEKVSINSVHCARSISWKSGGQQLSSRMSENEMSRLANPQSGLLNRSKSRPSQERADEVHSNPNDYGTSQINYYDTMAKDISEQIEIPGDISTGKLVV